MSDVMVDKVFIANSLVEHDGGCRSDIIPLGACEYCFCGKRCEGITEWTKLTEMRLSEANKYLKFKKMEDILCG